MEYTENYYIGASALPAGGAVELRIQDLDAPESGRDEAGFYHRVVLRRGLRTWVFSYSRLTRQEYEYLLGLLPGETAFLLTHPQGESTAGTRCWCAGITANRRDGIAGQYREVSFTVTEC